MKMILIMSVIFIIGFPVVGGLRARDGEIFVRVDFLKHTQKHKHTFMSGQLIPLLSLTLQYDLAIIASSSERSRGLIAECVESDW